MHREECLRKAAECVCDKRQDEYGNPDANFALISDMWSAYLNRSITPKDVAIMMALLKIARIKTGTAKGDNYIDLAGYAAIAAELDLNLMEPLRKEEYYDHTGRDI